MQNEVREQEVREQFENYIKVKGVKVRWIAKQIGLSESTLSHWRKGRRDISTKHLQALEEIINKNSHEGLFINITIMRGENYEIS